MKKWKWIGLAGIVGVAAGSFLVNLQVALSGAPLASWPGAFGVAAAIALGAAAQATVGARLLERRMGRPVALTDARGVLAFLLWGAVASCLVNSTWGTGVLVATDAVAPALALRTWWTWWVGDCLGVVVFGPLTLIALGEPRELWRARLPAGGQATPMTYRLAPEARQFVVIAAGGHGRFGTTLGDSVVAFALPREGS